MPSTALSAQGTILQIATGTGGAKTITAVTQANPGVVSSTAHGLNNGDVVTIAAVVGMTQLNGNSYTVEYTTTNAFALKNTNTTGFTAYTSGGTATPVTFTAIGNVKSFNGFDGSATEIDVTNFASVAKEKRLGLQDFGSLSMELHLDNSDAGQLAARVAQAGATQKNFKLILPSGTTPTATFAAFVKQFPLQGGVDAVVAGTIALTINGAVAWS
jgi:hypothetical protein